MKLTTKITIFLILLVSIFTISLMLFEIQDSANKQISLSKKMLLQEASAHFENIVVTRSWNAGHGGLYAKAKKGEKPNPYLKNNTLLTKDNELLIKINPAWMTRQISELSNEKSKYYYKITSLKPINPHNKADKFETEALQYLEKNRSQTIYYKINQDMSEFDFLGALNVNESCMECHAHQGYKVNDIRGGIRVSIPTDIYQVKISEIKRSAKYMNITVIVIGLIITLGTLTATLNIIRSKDELELLNKNLDDKVKTRTRKLHDMLEHERYLKELLKTIADVNELLIGSFSLKSIIKNSIERLNDHAHYRYIWLGMKHDNLLEVIEKSDKGLDFLQNTVYATDVENVDSHVQTAVQAISKNKTIIEKTDDTTQEVFKRREDDALIKYIISLPLKSTESEEALGVITIYSDCKNGFKVEEIKMLENLSTDIGLALHTLKQRHSLEEMEFEKISNYEETILAFVNIIEQRDSYTAGHTIRVARYCRLIATEMGFKEYDIVRLEKAAILHDIGKVATPDAILLKPGRLTPLEYELIKQHAEAGYKMLSRIEIYKDLADIIRYHHIRYDGKGYPRTSSPDDVPMMSHIMVLADAFDAMTSNRIYKPRKEVSETLKEMAEFSGSQFHPEVVRAALVALQGIEIEDSRQMPSSELEERRFYYFFQDQLTDTYNENYLNIVLNDEKRQHNKIFVLSMRHFSQFNKKNGWDGGNQMLKFFVHELKTMFETSIIFRIRGDNFVILLQNGELNIDEINNIDEISKSVITIEAKSALLEDGRSYAMNEIDIFGEH